MSFKLLMTLPSLDELPAPLLGRTMLVRQRESTETHKKHSTGLLKIDTC